MNFKIFIFCLFSITFHYAESNDLLDISCRTIDDCKVFKNVAACLNEQCICMDEFTKEIDCEPTQTKLNNQIGGECPCSSIPGSVCVNGICMCEKNLAVSSDRRRCISKAVPLGDICENDSQCSRNNTFSYCNLSDRKCTCREKFAINDEGICHSLIEIGKVCENDTMCHHSIENSHCLNKACQCKDGTVANHDQTKCLIGANYHEHCEETDQCKLIMGTGAICAGKCKCEVDFEMLKIRSGNETKVLCENRVAIGDICSVDTDCHQFHTVAVQTMLCNNKECFCIPSYEENGQYCKKRAVQLIKADGSWSSIGDWVLSLGNNLTDEFNKKIYPNSAAGISSSILVILFSYLVVKIA